MKNILLTKEAGIALVTINRPPMNALNSETLLELKGLFNELESDEEVKVVIITAAGEKAFVAGADIKELSLKTPAQALEFAKLGQEVFNLIENLSKPVLAAVNGYALGGGTELALACDMVIASLNAKFGQPEIKLGIIPGFGGTQRLSRVVGKNLAKELIFTGELLPAQEAYRIGLVNKVVKPDELLPSAKELASKIAGCKLAVKVAKQIINKGVDTSLEKGLELEAQAFSECFSTQDAKEGLSAFLAKRKPEFKGE